MIRLIRQLRKNGVLGINRRNADYTLKYNRRSKYPIVDDKLNTKNLAIQSGLPVPQMYAVLAMSGQTAGIHRILNDYEEFVVKPAHGSGGNGIWVIKGRMGQVYKKVSGDLIRPEDLNYHISNILSGLYSLGGQPDKVIIEYCVNSDPLFESVSWQGVPDIRIIVFFGVPVMAMIRLPTRMSDGKANLHQGAIGVGIDMASGRTLKAVWKNSVIAMHPDTSHVVTDIMVPAWEDLLHLASRCYDLTGLVYQGVDMVLDREKGPMILELNARPGLNIQIANEAGLLSRLQKVEAFRNELKTMDDKIDFARREFGV